MTWFFVLSGLFLGWSLGANDAANVFGTAVSTRMVRFRTAAIVAGVFVVLGAVFGGAGTTHTLGRLGAVNALAGSFTVALAAGLAVTWMTRLHMPVSTSQAIVGAIVGWNVFTGVPTDYDSLLRIVLTWIVCPILAAVVAALLFTGVRSWAARTKTHLLYIDLRTRVGLVVVGAVGSWALGANNIANVMGVFVPAIHLRPVALAPWLVLNSAQQLFLLGGLAIAVGIFTYSIRTMRTVGQDLFKLTPLTALVVVLAETVVLFVFASEALEGLLARSGLPTLPLVPVSSSQAVVGAVIGIGLAKGARGVNLHVLRGIARGWVLTPIAAGLVCYVSLFFVQNVFEQTVVRPQDYEVNAAVVERVRSEGIDHPRLERLEGLHFDSAREFRHALFTPRGFRLERHMHVIFETARVHETRIDSTLAKTEMPGLGFDAEEIQPFRRLHGREFLHDWQLDAALAAASAAWRLHEGANARVLNKSLRRKAQLVHQLFERPEPGAD